MNFLIPLKREVTSTEVMSSYSCLLFVTNMSSNLKIQQELLGLWFALVIWLQWLVWTQLTHHLSWYWSTTASVQRNEKDSDFFSRRFSQGFQHCRPSWKLWDVFVSSQAVNRAVVKFSSLFKPGYPSWWVRHSSDLLPAGCKERNRSKVHDWLTHPSQENAIPSFECQ